MKTPGIPRAVPRSLVTIAISSVLAALSVAKPSVANAQANIEFPEEGTPVERVQRLWQTSRSHILADAKAALSDAEYQKRRSPIWGAWTRLQMSLAGESSDAVSRLIPDVLGLLNRTYGWTADSPAKRQEIRDRSRAFTAERVAEIDKRVAALK